MFIFQLSLLNKKRIYIIKRRDKSFFDLNSLEIITVYKRKQTYKRVTKTVKPVMPTINCILVKDVKTKQNLDYLMPNEQINMITFG